MSKSGGGSDTESRDETFSGGRGSELMSSDFDNRSCVGDGGDRKLSYEQI
jgi:hypothetical protein